MTAAAWAQAFPGGVADADLQHGLMRSVNGHVVAVRLADGQVLWRSGEVLHPLLLGHGLAVCLAFVAAPVAAPGTSSAPAPAHAGEHGVAHGVAQIVALDLHQAGAERWRSAALPWPEWALQGDAPAASRVVHAGWLGDRILLCWSLQPLYRGGAAPGPSRGKAAAAPGSCVLDVANGSMHDAPAEFDSFTAPPAPHQPSDDPSVTAQQVLRGVRYSLRQTPAPAAVGRPLNAALNTTWHTTLTATDTVRGLDLWCCLLDEAPRKLPRALRP